MKTRRALLYPMVLLLMTFLLVLGGAMLSHQVGYRRAAVRDRQQLQARLLAEAGLEDMRLKWQLDPSFPPGGADVERYSYSEQLGEDGRFEVEIDLRFQGPPTRLLRVASRGVTNEGASLTLVGEWDAAFPARKPGSRWTGVGGDEARIP